MLTALLLTLAIAPPPELTRPILADDERQSTVGMPAHIDQLVLPGPELEVRPLEDSRSPVVLRISNVFRHGTGYRYDMVYYGLEPGHYDLRKYLRRKDVSTADDLTAIPVEIQPVLPPGQIEPNSLQSRPAPRLGGYRVLVALGAVVWIAGLLAILFVGRKKRTVETESGTRPVSLADRLRPMVEAAIAGRLTLTEQAELERLLLAYWRRRLNLENSKPAEAIAKLRGHAEAGQVLRQLEAWLHRPPGPSDAVDVAGLLMPYRSLAAEVSGSRE